jgi:hypothetical protein
VPRTLKDVNQATLLALAAATLGLLVTYGLIDNGVEQHYLTLVSIFLPIAFLIGKTVLQWKHVTTAAVIAVVTAVVLALVQAGFIDSAHGKAAIGVAELVIPIAIILVQALGGFLSGSVPSRGGNGPPINTPVP